MNVKPGDLAITVKSAGGNLGKIVEVIGPMGENPFFDGRIWNRGKCFCWMVKGNCVSAEGLMLEYMPAPDDFLRPVSGLPDVDVVAEENSAPLHAD